MANAARTSTRTDRRPNGGLRFIVARRMAAKRAVDATVAKPEMRAPDLTAACLAAAGFDEHRAHYA